MLPLKANPLVARKLSWSWILISLLVIGMRSSIAIFARLAATAWSRVITIWRWTSYTALLVTATKGSLFRQAPIYHNAEHNYLLTFYRTSSVYRTFTGGNGSFYILHHHPTTLRCRSYPETRMRKAMGKWWCRIRRTNRVSSKWNISILGIATYWQSVISKLITLQLDLPLISHDVQ